MRDAQIKIGSLVRIKEEYCCYSPDYDTARLLILGKIRKNQYGIKVVRCFSIQTNPKFQWFYLDALEKIALK